ncbi:hypothetical protein FOVG_18172 [Fusarium oxysporum f. sp. pisi HDV247]|uniref:Zn(2)-C6 fungal-type domain-containing protein n=1 Tax=Fusarium oxysporum f. sp. pisi HDV247 TaxID=1080344 RepID=W9NI83_FUSOX|nr:hypothetical protein FOVG_18172 [Fusarium oxysporum f. sp. pisi HDV247]
MSKYRHLLPVPNPANTFSQSQPSGSSSTLLSSEKLPKRQRVGAQLACNECRRRKVRCDGQRPHCGVCQQRGEKEPCTYAKTRSHSQRIKEAEQILELFNLLRTGSENQALESLRILRSHNDVESVLNILKASRSQEQCPQGREQAPISTRHLGLEYELMARNAVVFPPLQAPGSNLIKVALSTDRLSTTLDERSESPLRDGASVSADSEADQFSAHRPIYIKRAISTLRLCDERLEELNMSFWTSVSISDDVAAKIISLYLETDHPLLGTFEPDLFVDDLTSCRLRHCSPLLVSAIMYWGCQMYSGFNPSIKEYIPQFCEEAEHRWTDEKATDSLLNLASTQLLGLAYLGDGKDHHVLTYVSEANAMATRMGLFGVDPTEAASKAQEITPALQNATSHAAWGTFNWIVFMSLFYQQPGLAYPEYPPVLPIPGFAWHGGRDESANSVRQSLHSAYMGDTFPALCQFWRIIHEVTLRYYRDQPNPRGRLSDHVRLAFAEYKYRELIAWAETLPSSMMRSEQSPHHVLTFHIWFHCAVLDILRPFTAQARSAPISSPFKTFSCENSSPDVAYKASVNQLKRLIIVYRKNYAAPIYTMLWHTALIRVANAVLSDAKDSEWHFYLSFCIQCYGSLRRSYRFAEAIGRSLLSMTLQRRDLSVGEARHMLQQFEENRLNSSSEDIRATFMADLNLSMTHPEEASVESLANKFEDIALFREFTSQEGLIADGTMDSDEATFTVIPKRRSQG